MYLAQMLLAIECVHENDMIHRDIKPANIFIEESKGDIQILKIGDFGSARLDLKDAIENKDLNINVDTSAYWPPEIIKN